MSVAAMICATQAAAAQVMLASTLGNTTVPSDAPIGGADANLTFPSGRPSRFPIGRFDVNGVGRAFPSGRPSNFPSGRPTRMPYARNDTNTTNAFPSGMPSDFPTRIPRLAENDTYNSEPIFPSGSPSLFPSGMPTGGPYERPTGRPSGERRYYGPEAGEDASIESAAVGNGSNTTEATQTAAAGNLVMNSTTVEQQPTGRPPIGTFGRRSRIARSEFLNGDRPTGMPVPAATVAEGTQDSSDGAIASTGVVSGSPVGEDSSAKKEKETSAGFASKEAMSTRMPPTKHDRENSDARFSQSQSQAAPSAVPAQP